MSMPINKMGNRGLSSISAEKDLGIAAEPNRSFQEERRMTGEIRMSSPLCKRLLPKGRE